MKTEAGVTMHYFPDTELKETNISKSKDLDKLAVAVELFIRTEKTRLIIERQFLQSIIDKSSYGAAEEKAKWQQAEIALQDIKKFLGLGQKTK